MWWFKPHITPLIGKKQGLACALAVSLLTAGCGFQPLYGKSQGGDTLKQNLSAVEVGIIPDRMGQQLRNGLEQRFERGAGNAVKKQFILNVALRELREEAGYRKDNTPTRATLRVIADARLMVGSRQVWMGQSESVAAYNILPEHFATVMAERDARERVINDLADQISQAVAVYLAANPTAAEAAKKQAAAEAAKKQADAEAAKKQPPAEAGKKP